MKLFLVLGALFAVALGRPQSKIDSVQENKLRFLYFPLPQEQVEIFTNDTRSLSNLKPATKTIFILDGFTSFFNTSMNQETKNTFSVNPDLNVILVDWSAYSGYYGLPIESLIQGLALYTHVLVNNLPKVGNEMSEFIQFIHENKGISYENVTLISHSLGCHAAGATGRASIAKYNKQIGRIVAEDPALQFSVLDAPYRLGVGDAAVVEVYNTNREQAGDIYPATGDVTFYVNGGENQPCEPSPTEATVKAEFTGLTPCHSHAFSYKLYNYLATNTTVKACPCKGATCLCQGCDFQCGNDGITVGPNIPENARGSFHVKTGYLDW